MDSLALVHSIDSMAPNLCKTWKALPETVPLTKVATRVACAVDGAPNYPCYAAGWGPRHVLSIKRRRGGQRAPP